MTCPKCDGEIDSFKIARWGDGVQRQSMAPYICGWCASLFVIDTSRKALYSPEDIKRETGLDVLALIESNQRMWTAITDSQKMIRALPSRRPVLR